MLGSDLYSILNILNAILNSSESNEVYKSISSELKNKLKKIAGKNATVFRPIGKKGSTANNEKTPDDSYAENMFKNINPDKINKDKEITEDYLLQYLKEVNKELNQQRQERLKQARLTFYLSIYSLIFGVIVVLIGIVLLFTINVSVGTVTSAIGLMSNFISLLIFKLNKESNDRLDLLSDKLAIFDKTALTLQVLKQFTDTKVKDKALKIIIADLSPKKRVFI